MQVGLHFAESLETPHARASPASVAFCSGPRLVALDMVFASSSVVALVSLCVASNEASLSCSNSLYCSARGSRADHPEDSKNNSEDGPRTFSIYIQHRCPVILRNAVDDLSWTLTSSLATLEDPSVRPEEGAGGDREVAQNIYEPTVVIPKRVSPWKCTHSLSVVAALVVSQCHVVEFSVSCCRSCATPQPHLRL